MHQAHSATSRNRGGDLGIALAPVAYPMVALGIDVALVLWSRGG